MTVEESLDYLPAILIGSNFLFACFAGFAAGARGRSEGGWFLLTLIFGIVALFSLALFPVNEDNLAETKVRRKMMRWCPNCLRAIATRATKCCYCHSEVDPLRPN